MPEVGDIVAVYWDDAYFKDMVDKPELQDDEYGVLTFGQLIRYDEAGAWVAHEQLYATDTDTYRAVTRVPLALIRHIDVLGKAPAQWPDFEGNSNLVFEHKEVSVQYPAVSEALPDTKVKEGFFVVDNQGNQEWVPPHD